MSSGTVSVKLNNTIGRYFKSGKGVRQGDPLSPFLFNIAVDTLAKMISLAQRNNLIKGLVPEYIENGAVVLQYADDTILCIQDNKEHASYLKLLLYLYEDMFGLKINFAKSEVIMVSQDETKSLEFSNMFNCAIGKWSIKYLGVPVAGSRLYIADWLPIIEKIMKRLDGWKGSSLSLGGRPVLINSCLSNLPVYAMSMFWLPVSVLDKMDTTRKKFFWQGGNMKKKYHLIK
jgi:mannosylglycoprotein endo-beta-mannosidase